MALTKRWVMAPISRSKKLARVKQFFRFCQESGWIQASPAKALKPPIFRRKQVVPFTPEELEKILWATEIYPDVPKGRRAEVRAFVLLIRYTGLRIGDCVALRWDNINDDKILLRTAKTGTTVWLPIPEAVEEALRGIPKALCGHIFWSGNGTLRSAISSWHRSMSTLSKLAGVKGHPHQFRHTLACELLSKGVSMENVAAILGHQDIKITQSYYAAWVPSRQKALTAEIEKAWGNG